VCVLDRRQRGPVAVQRGQVARTVTVRRAEPLDRSVGEPTRDRTLDVGAGRTDHLADRGRGVAEQVVDVPVSGLPLPGREFAVAVDAGEPAGTERRPRVGVPPAVEHVRAERAHLDGRVAREFHQQRVRSLHESPYASERQTAVGPPCTPARSPACGTEASRMPGTGARAMTGEREVVREAPVELILSDVRP